MTEKIKVLFLAANPVNVAYRPHLDQEAHEISERIQIGTKRDQFDFITQWAMRPEDLQKALLRFKPHIVHFSGHGSKTQGIILQDYAGNMVPVSKNALVGLFKVLKDNIRVVLLNACYSKAQAEGISQTIDYTIGMKKAVGDEAAIAFSSAFYQGLAFGRTVKESFELAKNQIQIAGIRESKTPVLTVRDGVNPLEPFLPHTQQSDPGLIPPQDSRPAAGGPVQNINTTGGPLINQGPIINQVNGDAVFNNNK
jgi:hypothetical protein